MFTFPRVLAAYTGVGLINGGWSWIQLNNSKAKAFYHGHVDITDHEFTLLSRYCVVANTVLWPAAIWETIVNPNERKLDPADWDDHYREKQILAAHGLRDMYRCYIDKSTTWQDFDRVVNEYDRQEKELEKKYQK
jgi:hypothetical protein